MDGVLKNKGSVSAGRTSTPAVTAGYAPQFEQDFKRFLASRAEEMVPGGWMVLSLYGRPAKDFSSQDRYPEFIAEILQDLASQVAGSLQKYAWRIGDGNLTASLTADWRGARACRG